MRISRIRGGRRESELVGLAAWSPPGSGGTSSLVILICAWGRSRTCLGRLDHSAENGGNVSLSGLAIAKTRSGTRDSASRQGFVKSPERFLTADSLNLAGKHMATLALRVWTPALSISAI